jgi:hypothetical protein
MCEFWYEVAGESRCLIFDFKPSPTRGLRVFCGIRGRHPTFANSYSAASSRRYNLKQAIAVLRSNGGACIALPVFLAS